MVVCLSWFLIFFAIPLLFGVRESAVTDPVVKEGKSTDLALWRTTSLVNVRGGGLEERCPQSDARGTELPVYQDLKYERDPLMKSIRQSRLSHGVSKDRFVMVRSFSQKGCSSCFSQSMRRYLSSLSSTILAIGVRLGLSFSFSVLGRFSPKRKGQR